MIREAREEAGIAIDPDTLEFVHVMHREPRDERMSLFFRCKQWQGTPHNAEPHKCDHLAWFDYQHLPQNMVPYIAAALNHVHDQVIFSEFNW